MLININSKDYWDQRFSNGDWIKKGGPEQTKNFAFAQLKYLNLPKIFDGTILDFGCGLGDAILVFHNKFPNARLIGFDFSEGAINYCRRNYTNIAEFICGDFTVVPYTDVIITSNVIEHIPDYINVVRHLKSCCRDLYIIVPYNEILTQNSEHFHSFTKNSFIGVLPYTYKVFIAKGWSQFGFSLFYNIYFKNIFRALLGKKLQKRNKQIIFHFQ